MDRPLLEAQLRLHALDPAPLARALGDAVTFEGYLAALERRRARAGLAGLAQPMQWLHEHRPPPDAPAAVLRRASTGTSMQSILITARGFLRSASAVASTVRVFPEPVGPRKRKFPIGRPDGFIPVKYI
jgi:hypothetical protein